MLNNSAPHSFVDVHCHLTHEKYSKDLDQVLEHCHASGLGAVVVNGTDAADNRKVLELCAQYPLLKPALGIYPINALNPKFYPNLHIPEFSVSEEVKFIKEQAMNKKIIAVGECGLDGHWVDSSTFLRQESVFISLLEISIEADIPIIIHSRKCEERAFEIVDYYGAKKVDFHCYCGKTKSALKWAEKHPWMFSIPSIAVRQDNFKKLLKELPITHILTETDGPYLPPISGDRNDPSTVPQTIGLMAALREISTDSAKEQVWSNFERIFNPLNI